MGIIKQGILGGVSGSVGNVVGSSWKGLAILKAKPLSVSNPQTAGQVAQRGAFGQCVAFAVLILSNVIKPLWDRFAVQMSGYNAFVSANISAFDADGIATPADIKISSGKMASEPIATVTATNGSATVGLTWGDYSPDGFKLATDKVYAVVHNRTQGNMAVSAGINARSHETVSLTMPTNVATDDEIDFYLAFRRTDGTIVSDTSYKLKEW